MARYSAKQKEALDTLMKDDVYRHAVELITAEGLQGLTMDRIAKAVGVSRATLYNYFRDRDDVVEHVENRTFTPLLETLEGIAAGDGAPADKLTAVARAIFAGVHESRALVVALTPEKHRLHTRPEQQRRRARGYDALAQIMRQGIERGEFRDLPVRGTTEVFFGTVFGLVHEMVYDGEVREADELVPMVMDVMLGGLRAAGGGAE